ncbi:MAG: TRASH domain-containing protein [Candidatus Omnitrophica bacterium]|nr:TRASH domain-containing protein [Candidatus Omnitrophota bacterium]
MGDPYQIEYDGKIYNLCCSMCAKDFQKDPEKFIKKINEELELENAEHDHNHEDHDH